MCWWLIPVVLKILDAGFALGFSKQAKSHGGEWELALNTILKSPHFAEKEDESQSPEVPPRLQAP